MTNFTKWRSIIDGSGDIPDSDLTQYTVSDPQNNLSNITATSYDYTGDRESDPLLFKPVEVTDFTYSFDLNITQYSNGERKFVGSLSPNLHRLTI